jgi:hypothetical protein
MKWATWENIGVDRMGSIWLIRRWIDPKAEFLFIPADTKSLPKDAEPFDIPGTRYSHHGNHCTFQALLKAYNVQDPILSQIASIIDEADLVQEINIEPISPGLDAVCRGMRRISADDYEALERGVLLYEALYTELSVREG